MDFVFPSLADDDWPKDCYEKYERVDVLGKGSFGMVWMSRRIGPREDEFDEDFVAIKNIQIKNEKGKVYAEREIRILHELKHPNVIRLVQAYPVYNSSRVVVMQLARGPNLHQLVVKRGALGLPLARLVSRQLIAAVSYIHGRAVLHRDIKPSNCILALTEIKNQEYDWYGDHAIWSNKADGVEGVAKNRWKLMLVDFGFARALETNEIEAQTKKMRNSIVFETSASAPKQGGKLAATEEAAGASSSTNKETAASFTPRSMYPSIPEDNKGAVEDDSSIEADMATLENLVIHAAAGLRRSHFEATNTDEQAIMGVSSEEAGKMRPRLSGVSMALPELPVKNTRRISTARSKVRSMSALGTKAYAAPEIRKQLRHKNESDFEKANAAMTECVADYGMIVDAYSVGWTLRVALTGVPPNFSISEYMQERETVVLEDSQEDEPDNVDGGCCCFSPVEFPLVRIRDPSHLPAAATLMITRMTERRPENRMTVREAQLDPWIAGGADDTDPVYNLPTGDVPSKHGDVVVPLKCAAELSNLTVQFHTQ